jgi:integrase
MKIPNWARSRSSMAQLLGNRGGGRSRAQHGAGLGRGGHQTRIGNHSFRATGITAYLKNGGLLETARQMAAHVSPRTTGLYDRRSDDLSG